jgi:hypothetical protein
MLQFGYRRLVGFIVSYHYDCVDVPVETLLPPSWLIRLPQKFSAATTLIGTKLDDVVEVTEVAEVADVPVPGVVVVELVPGLTT